MCGLETELVSDWRTLFWVCSYRLCQGVQGTRLLVALWVPCCSKWSLSRCPIHVWLHLASSGFLLRTTGSNAQVTSLNRLLVILVTEFPQVLLLTLLQQNRICSEVRKWLWKLVIENGLLIVNLFIVYCWALQIIRYDDFIAVSWIGNGYSAIVQSTWNRRWTTWMPPSAGRNSLNIISIDFY